MSYHRKVYYSTYCNKFNFTTEENSPFAFKYEFHVLLPRSCYFSATTFHNRIKQLCKKLVVLIFYFFSCGVLVKQTILIEMVCINKTHTHAQQTLTKITLEKVSMKISGTLLFKSNQPFPFYGKNLNPAPLCENFENSILRLYNEGAGGVPTMYIHKKIKVFTFIFQNDMVKLKLLTLSFTSPLNIKVLSSRANNESRV